ncbi:MAG: hypothetical protein JRC66_06710 [Deltaproteobacteria bacterium]|nr:hypothetical protein [Deltaproteobacteria bacterium]
MICDKCMKKHDYTCDLPAQLNKLDAIGLLMTGLRGTPLLTIEAVQGLGGILCDIHYELQKMHDELYCEEGELQHEE